MIFLIEFHREEEKLFLIVRLGSNVINEPRCQDRQELHCLHSNCIWSFTEN